MAHLHYENGTTVSYMYFLFGMNIKDQSSNNKKHDYKSVIDAIHFYHQAHPESGVPMAYLENLCQAIDIAYEKKAFVSIFNFLEYEIEKAEKQTNTFSLDFGEILLQMEKRILTLRKKYDCGDKSMNEKARIDLESDLEEWFYEKKKIIKDAYAKFY